MKIDRILSLKLLSGICFAIFFLVTLSIASAQSTPDIEWQKCLGGSGDDYAFSIQQTSEGGYIIVGWTFSNDGNVTGNHGDFDYWVVKLDVSGNVVWQKCLGGSNDDRAYSIQQTSDGGYIVAGRTSSNDGNVTGNHGNWDNWIVKLDTEGNIVWQKCLGGSNLDSACSIQQTSDGGYIVAGDTYSNDGNVTGKHGGTGSWDYWIVKLDANGNVVWQKCLGGTSDDNARSIEQTSDSGYIVVGYTSSNDGNVTGNHGDFDYWVVKLDASGNVVWQKCLGGSGYGPTGYDYAYSIQQTSDGGYIVAGETHSNNGDVTGKHGDTDSLDYWIVKLDTSGNIVWQKCLGGSDNDDARSIEQTSDGGYIVAGGTHSTDGNVTGKHGNGWGDYWVVKLDASGNIVWQKCLGGSDDELGESIQQTSDGSYIVAGLAGSNDGNITGNHHPGYYDYWVVKLDEHSNSSLTVEPGPDQTVEEGTNVNFEGSFTPSGSHTYSYHWDFGDGSKEGSSLIISHTYADDGVYTVNLTVTDEEGNSGNDTLLVIVNNANPIVESGPDLEVTAGDPVSFAGTFLDSGWLDTHTAEWNFGEGTIEAGSAYEENESPNSTGAVSGNFSYFNAGNYTVTLKVSDDDGGIGQDQATITVLPIAAKVDFDPDTLNLGSGGNWVTAYVELPQGYTASNIDIGSVLLNDVVPAVSDSKYGFVTNESEYLTDIDADGISERMFKFSRENVEGILKSGNQVKITLTGKIKYENGISSGMASFEGSDLIKVIEKGSKKDKTKK